MHDVEMMSQIRHERDSLQTNFSLLEQKWKKMCDENSKLKDKVEELKIEVRTNLEASRHNPTPDRTIQVPYHDLAWITKDSLKTCRKTTNRRSKAD
jgi:predicted nuclease with TOPRIM domain